MLKKQLIPSTLFILSLFLFQCHKEQAVEEIVDYSLDDYFPKAVFYKVEKPVPVKNYFASKKRRTLNRPYL